MASKLFFLISSLLLLNGCIKQSTPERIVEQRADSAAVIKASGDFISEPGQSVTGKLRIYSAGNHYQLALEDFSSSNGPDLKVYLSKEIHPANFVNLGSLKATSGNQLYNIPDNVTITDFKYALIFCQQYSHLFGYAELKP